MNFSWTRGGFIYLNSPTLCESVAVLTREDLDKPPLYPSVKKKIKIKIIDVYKHNRLKISKASPGTMTLPVH